MNLLKCIAFVISLLICTSGKCVDLLNISYHKALKLAKEQNKIVFFQIYSGECSECDQVAKRGLSGESLNELSQDILAVGIESYSVDSEFITSKYRIKRNAPSSLIVDKNGNFISAM